MLRNPELARRDCKDCWQYLYNDKTGEREQWRGHPVHRPVGSAPPCFHARCKKISPDAFTGLLLHNWMAYEHYLECKATGHFPDDPIVKRNARVIRSMEDEVHKSQQVEQQMMAMAVRARM